MKKRNVLYYSIKSVVYSIISLTIFLLIYFLYESKENILICDASIFTAFSMFLLTLLDFSFTKGYLDILFYGTSNFISMFKASLNRRYKDLNEYKEEKNKTRRLKNLDYLIPLIIGIIFLIVALIAYFLN